MTCFIYLSQICFLNGGINTFNFEEFFKQFQCFFLTIENLLEISFGNQGQYRDSYFNVIHVWKHNKHDYYYKLLLYMLGTHCSVFYDDYIINHLSAEKFWCIFYNWCCKNAVLHDPMNYKWGLHLFLFCRIEKGGEERRIRVWRRWHGFWTFRLSFFIRVVKLTL